MPRPGDIGGDTWPAATDPDPLKAQAFMHGGGTVWQAPAIDPELGMIYFSTGNAGPDYDGSVRPGDNLFTASIVALDYKTGQYKWHFQEVHHDIWDYDGQEPRMATAATQPYPVGDKFVKDCASPLPGFPWPAACLTRSSTCRW